MEENNQTQDQTSDGIREALNDCESKMKQHVVALRQELTDVVPSVKELIEKYPVGSAVTAAGIGLAIGYLIAGGQDKKKDVGRKHDDDGGNDLPF